VETLLLFSTAVEAVKEKKKMARLIKTAFLEDDVINSAKLADGAVVAAALGSNAVIEAKIASGAVTNAKLGADAVNGDKIADNAIANEHLSDGCVDTAELAADSVTAAKVKIAYGDSLRFVNASSVEVGLSIDSDGDLVGPSSTKMATQSYVTTAVSNLIDSAPAALDTLNELAAALGDNPNFSTTITSLIGDGFTGAGLSSTGSYSSPGGTYLGSETSLKGGLSTLDSSLSSAVTSLTSSISSNVTSLEGKINTVEASVGLAADGSYTAFSGSNYMDTATSITGALEDLDAQAATNAGGITSLNSSVSTINSSLTSINSSITSINGDISTVEGKADRALAVVPKQDVIVISADDITNSTVSFDLNFLARWHDRVVVQYGNLILVPGASYDFQVSSDATNQDTTITLSSDYAQNGGKPLSQGDVLVVRYDYDSSFTYS